MKKLSFYFINGRPGSGKDSQADLLLEDIPGAIKISTGGLIREAKPDGEYPQFHSLVAPYVEESKAGGLIPSNVVFQMVTSVMDEKLREGRDTFIFTGFPRRMAQLDTVDNWLGGFTRDGYEVDAKHVLLSVLPETARSRAKFRRENAKLKNEDPRDDDLEATVETRLINYGLETHPMINRFIRRTGLSL